MNKPVVSIIIPVFNCESYLEKCIISVVNQTFTSWELILINDGSTDNSYKICKSFSSKYSNIFVIDIPNQGVSNARNVGLDRTIGDYILFIDSDDWIDPRTLEISIDAIKKFDSDIILFSYYRVKLDKEFKDNYLSTIAAKFQNSQYIRHRSVGFYSNQIDYPTKTDAFNAPWAKLYKRSVIGNIRYVERAQVGMEDVLFNIQVFNNASNFHYLNNFLYYYRLDNPTSLTKTDTKSLHIKFEKLFDYIEKSNFFDSTFVENLDNRIACSLINITLSLTHRSNRQGLINEYYYLKTIIESKRYRNSLMKFSLNNLSLQWKLFFFLAKYRFTLFLLLLSYIIRLVK
jgi:glycosyltransferase involved in cell wall biosynthesis